MGQGAVTSVLIALVEDVEEEIWEVFTIVDVQVVVVEDMIVVVLEKTGSGAHFPVGIYNVTDLNRLLPITLATRLGERRSDFSWVAPLIASANGSAYAPIPPRRTAKIKDFILTQSEL